MTDDGRYERLRAAVVEALDAEIGDDVVALRRLLMDALNDDTLIDLIRESPVPGVRVEDSDLSGDSVCACCAGPWPCDMAGLYPHRKKRRMGGSA